MWIDPTQGATTSEREEGTSPWMVQTSLRQSVISTTLGRKTSQPYDLYVDPSLFTGVRCLLRQEYAYDVGSADFAMGSFSNETSAPEARSDWQAALRILKELRAERVMDIQPTIPLIAEEVEVVDFKPIRSRLAKVKVISRRKGGFFRDFDLEF